MEKSFPIQITEVLKEEYESVYIIPMETVLVSNPHEFFKCNNAAEQLNNIFPVKEDTLEALDKLDPDSSAGPVGMQSILLKKCKRSLAEPLEILFHSFLQSGKVPSIL